MPEAWMHEACARVEAKLREGYRPAGMTGHGLGAIDAASVQAVQDGWVRTAEAFRKRLRTGKLLGLEPDWGLYRPARYQQPAPRVVLQPAAPPRSYAFASSGERVMVIGDLHQDPRHPDRLDVLTWLGRMASERRPSRIIQIGDWHTWDSCSAHDRNDTQAGRLKPSIATDQDNLVQSLQAWRAGMASDYKPKLDITYGNHENRVERFENAHPESVGTFTNARDQAYAQFGWRTRPYGEIKYVQGVGFSHHPTNGAGRAFGGKTGPQRAANETTVSMIGGHTHRRQIHDAPKIGPLEAVSLIEVGCALPWGTIEHYAAHSATGWWWGACEVTCRDGVVSDIDFTSMATIRDRYSDDGADVRKTA